MKMSKDWDNFVYVHADEEDEQCLTRCGIRLMDCIAPAPTGAFLG